MQSADAQSKTAQFLWVQGELSTLERLCLASFVYHEFETVLYTYGQVANAPTGVDVRDGREILPESTIFTASGVSGPSYASFADLFRYHLLSQKGGWWFDTDFVCLKPPQPMQNLTFASTWEGEWRQCASNCAIWARQGDPHIANLKERCNVLLATEGPDHVKFGALGPFLVQHYIHENDLQSTIAPWWWFCPYPWRMIPSLCPRNLREYLVDQARQVKRRLSEFTKEDFRRGYLRHESRALHLHNEVWKAREFSKDADYFRYSIIEKLKRKYL